ncbi:unnamed protein product [Choristocarpus tenellus]
MSLFITSYLYINVSNPVLPSKARGASLVERHRADAAAAKKNEDGKAGKNKKWSWSREGDFEQRRRFTPQMYEELVQKSHELDSKFSRSISRTFL